MSEERHVVPVTADNEPAHRDDGFCWCQPIAEDVGLSGRLYVHRRSLDAPHYEVTDAEMEAAIAREYDA